MSELVERLRGDLKLKNGGLAPAHLVLDDDGLFLRDWSNPTSEISIDVLSAEPLRYLEGRFSDELEIGETTYGIPTGRGGVCSACSLSRASVSHGNRFFPGENSSSKRSAPSNCAGSRRGSSPTNRCSRGCISGATRASSLLSVARSRSHRVLS